MTAEVLVVEHEPEAGPGRLRGWLAGSGIECVVLRPYAGDPVPSAVAADGLIVLGGEGSAWQDAEYPWFPATRDLLRRAIADGTPTLAVCLGAQLLAMACGGRVERGAAGSEIGVVRVWRTANGDDPLFGRLPAALPSLQYHHDAITLLPPGAVRLARGDRYSNQAFRLGPAAWATQFHPEADHEIFAGWATAPELAATVADAAENDAALDAAWRPMAQGFAEAVLKAG